MPKKPSAPPAPAKTREQLMDERAAADFAAMDKINSDRTIEYKIMTEPGPRFEPQPSQRNAAAVSIPSADLVFSRIGGDFANSAYMRSRRPPGGG
jgi:hypothetical protein